jgi:protease-4
MEIARESIFVSSLRSFCRCFFSVFGIFLSLIVVSILYTAISPAKGHEDKTELTILPDLEGSRTLLSTAAPVILRINIHGVIGEAAGVNSETVEDILRDSHSGTLTHNRVKGILLHINTPGGTVVDSDNIYRMIKAYKEKYQIPVFAFVNGLCASGGMYIASSAEQIFASPPSVIGSIGVLIGPFFNVADAMGKIGVQSQTLTNGLDKDMMNPFRTWKEGEDNSLKVILSSFYNQFVTIVTENRPVDKTKLIDEYGAQVFDGEKAQEIGYIDVANASYDQALAALMQKANIDPAKPYQVIELKPVHNWLSALVCSKSPLLSGQVEHTLNFPNQKEKSIRDQFSYLYEPGRVCYNATN